MTNLKNYHKKKLEDMNLAPVIQEKNINTVMVLYNKIIIKDKNKTIAPII